jgi:hypothetical protein
MTRLDRRRFLLALGAGSALGGLASSRQARATEPATRAGVSLLSGRPLCFVGVYTPHGRAHELWQPRPGFDIAYPGSSLAPFDDPLRYGKSFKSRLLVVDGVDLSAGIAVGTVGHDAARVILTGSGADGKNASIDQFLAVERGLGVDTPHTSLTLAIGSDSTEIGYNLSYARGGAPIPKWIDPAQVFDSLFGRPVGAPQDLARQRRVGKSVLDVVRADLRGLAQRTPASERPKLEQHQVALREIEKRLTQVERSCAAPVRPNAFPRLNAYAGGEPYFEAIADLQIDLLARAMACDLTRFATLFLADLSRTRQVPGFPDDVHTDVAHRYDAQIGAHAGAPDTWQTLATQNRHSYGKVARLLQRLDEAGVLDDSIVYVSSDMGDPARHASRSVPTLLAGGAGGHFRFGRYLDLRADLNTGTPNNRLLVSIGQAFGQPEEHFGQATDPHITHGRLEALAG